MIQPLAPQSGSVKGFLRGAGNQGEITNGLAAPISRTLQEAFPLPDQTALNVQIPPL